MKQFLRIKMEGLEVLELDLSTIKGFHISAYEDGFYCLHALTDTFEYDLHLGTFDSCHFMLNKLHEQLNIYLVDI